MMPERVPAGPTVSLPHELTAILHLVHQVDGALVDAWREAQWGAEDALSGDPAFAAGLPEDVLAAVVDARLTFAEKQAAVLEAAMAQVLRARLEAIIVHLDEARARLCNVRERLAARGPPR